MSWSRFLAVIASVFFTRVCCFGSDVSFILPFTDCIQSKGRAGYYDGSIDVTESGVKCMNWSDITGFEERYPRKGLGRHNFCRNPDGRIRPWCFFRNNRGRIDWGYCDCKQGSVRLQGGRSKLDGTVEVYLNGVWGTICSNNWRDENAAVVCRQLGHGYKGRARQSPLSRQTLLPVHWHTVHCHGEEEDLLQCQRTVWNGGECANRQVAAVTCTPQEVAVFVPVRLVGGGSEYEGRVEVFHSGQWGTVCDDQWDDADAEVVCRQIGLGGTAKAWSQAYFGQGSGQVWLDEVQCTGNELSIEQCFKSLWGEHNCEHKEDAGVSCTPLTDGSLRLVGGPGSFEGRLEVFYKGQWGTVCDDGWTESNIQVVCRQLGFRYDEAAVQYRYGAGSGPIFFDDVSCSGRELSLSLCSRREWRKHDCTHQEDVSVTCSPERGFHGIPESLPIRLMDGQNKKEGRVEIYIHGQWGTICDDGWTDRDADVVCRQLGFMGLAKARTMAYFGEGKGPIHIDNVKCSGTERSLSDCIKQPIGTHNCRHSEDAGVICDYGEDTEKIKDHGASVCGLRLVHTRQKRIIGGENSLRGGWPWQAAIRLRNSQGEGRLVCGATLISSCWVLTSAHCFKRYGNSTKTYKVRVGDYHTLVPEEYEAEYGIEQIVPHNNYRPSTNDYDLALVQLVGHSGKCVSFSSHVLPACLPLRREKVLKVASNCFITGWGDTGRTYSKTLQQAAISVLHKRYCEERYLSQFTSRMLCAGNTQEDKWVDSCRGDSGGPLVCERPGGAWVVYGVTSWGHACRLQDSPGVYTKVSAFLPWIKRVTNL
ncbi:neurotrypsin isoform X2 [Lepisosteus oculatus]|uniref:neurotrypsin isoform X2 n=1 Tax=Lepisosteus oculatus TaxID=7918 RepID=UPI0003EAAA87|nr:PREDICTED: neurotrypsin isoform X2 [Lepisosteus oculatus]